MRLDVQLKNRQEKTCEITGLNNKVRRATTLSFTGKRKDILTKLRIVLMRKENRSKITKERYKWKKRKGVVNFRSTRYKIQKQVPNNRSIP